MEDNIRSFKRPHNPIFENVGNKRGKFYDQFSEIPHSSETTIYRILCHSRKIGSVIGKGGGVIKALREETQAKITVDDSIPGSEERVVIIHSPSTKKPVTTLTRYDMNLQCAAQDALLKVHDKILEEDIVSGNGTNNGNDKLVTTRMLVPKNMIGCLLGKRGDVIQRLRSETRANIRILPSDQLPVCALSTDELLQISAKPAIVKRALYEVSTLLHQHPRRDKLVPSGPHGFRPPGPQITNLPPPARWRGDYDHSRFGALEFDHHGGDTSAEFSMKILCPTAKIGGVIGKGGSNVRQIQQETGTDIHVVDDVAADSDERVICVSSFEDLMNPRSRTIDAILFLQEKTSDYSEKGIVSTRLLMPSSKVGCILGQGGQVINEMRRRTKADIRVYSRQEKPKFAAKDEELVQVSGLYGNVKDAIAEIASRYRARCLRDAKPEAQPSPHRFKDSGREYEPRSYPPPARDYEPYSHLAPHRDYEPYSHQALVRDYEPCGYRDPLRDYDLNDYVAPRVGGYPSPLRDYEYEPYGYQRFLGSVDMKMSSSGRGSSIGNASEITGTRPYGGASESSIADIHDPSQHLKSTHDSYQIYNGPKRPSPTSYEPYTNIHPTSHTQYNLYQNDPRHHEHYSQKSYHI